MEDSQVFSRNPEFILRQIAGESILVPAGSAAEHFSGLASLNASGLYLWELLAQPCTFRHLVQEVSRQYAVAEDVSRADVAEFLDLALGKGVVLRC